MDHEAVDRVLHLDLAAEPGGRLGLEGEVEELRASGKPTRPQTLGAEKAANCFRRADMPSVAAAVGMSGKSAAEVFAEVRARKNKF